MGVVNVDPTAKISGTQALNITRALFTNGANIGAMKADCAVASTDSIGSSYRLFENLDPRLRPLILLSGCSALTSGTAYDFGVYSTAGGAAIIDNVFADSVDLHLALALGI